MARAVLAHIQVSLLILVLFADLKSAFNAASMKDKEKFVFVFKDYEDKVKWYKYLAGT